MSLVSIIMPAFNAENTIKNSILSIQNQSYTNWELLVTDDNSIDSTAKIVQELASNDKRIKYALNKGESGAWSARNNSIKVAKGEYIAFLDSDDTWLPNKLKAQIEAMNIYNANASHCAYYRVNESGDVLNIKRIKSRVTLEDMLKQNCIGNLTGIYNSSVIGKFYQQNIGHEDYAMWLRILEKTDSVGVKEPLANYLVSTGSLSSNKVKAAKWHFNILRKQSGVNLLNVWYYFGLYIKNALTSRL